MCVPEGGGGEDSDGDADVDADAETAVVPGMEEADTLAETEAEAFVGLNKFVPIRNIDKCVVSEHQAQDPATWPRWQSQGM